MSGVLYPCFRISATALSIASASFSILKPYLSIIAADKIVAIGEIGLDYYYDDGAPRELQRKIFIEQIDVAKQMNKPIVVHNRDAHGDVMDILKKEAKGLTGVMHCYSGSWEMAKELIKMNFFLF